MGLYGQFEATVETVGSQGRHDHRDDGRGHLQLHEVELRDRPGQGLRSRPRSTTRATIPTPLLAVGEGFIQYLAENLLPGRKIEVTSQRLTPDRIVFRGRFG